MQRFEPHREGSTTPQPDEPGNAWQREVIARARTELPKHEPILAVYLIGSFGAGAADEYSDVDVHCVVEDEAVDWFGAHWPELAEEIAGPVVLADGVPGLIGGLAITPDWHHIDLAAHRRSAFEAKQYDGVRVLFDRDGTFFPDGDQPREAGRPGEPYWPEKSVSLFFYFLGNLVTVLGRDELVVADTGVLVIRDQLVALMLAERGVRRTGGVKRLNEFLSAEQRACLEAMPRGAITRADVLAANRYLCREFLRRGRALADRTGAAWPQAFADATLAHLHRAFGVDFAADEA